MFMRSSCLMISLGLRATFAGLKHRWTERLGRAAAGGARFVKRMSNARRQTAPNRSPSWNESGSVGMTAPATKRSPSSSRSQNRCLASEPSGPPGGLHLERDDAAAREFDDDAHLLASVLGSGVHHPGAAAGSRERPEVPDEPRLVAQVGQGGRPGGRSRTPAPSRSRNIGSSLRGPAG